MSVEFLKRGRYQHGTRARYVADKCRCALCREANRVYYHSRRQQARDAAGDVQPSRRAAPQWTAFMRSRADGSQYSVTAPMCPGANGKPCVQGGAWLKNGGKVCVACLERATIWNGLVSSRRARKHILELRAKGIGRHTVAAACDVSATVIAEVAAGRKKKIRAQTEKRILSVDEGARADHSLVPAAPTYALLNDLVARGFTGRWISRELGYVGTYASVLQCQKREFFTARNAVDIEKLHRRIIEQGIAPAAKWDRIPSADTHEKIDRLLAEGFTLKALSARIGIALRPAHDRRTMMSRATAEKVAHFYREIMAGEGDDAGEDLCEPREDEARIRRLAAAYQDGVAMQDLEKRFEMQERQIYRLLKKAGVPKRGQEGESADAA